MNPLEAATLCKLAKAACPQQAIDEYTPDAWFPLLDDLRFEDAKDALFAVVKRQPFVAPAEIRAEVRRIRHDRIITYGPLPEPPVDADESGKYAFELRDMIRRIGNGELIRGPEPEPIEGHAERLAELTKGAFQEVPDAD